LAVLLCALGLGLASGTSTPLLAWSTTRQLLAQPQAASYESAGIVETLEHLSMGMLGKLAAEVSSPLAQAIQTKSASDPASLVVVMLGSQVDASVLRSAARKAPQLNEMLSQAASSVILPFLTFQGQSFERSVATQLQQTGIDLQVVGCGSAPIDIATEVASVLAETAVFKVLIVCISQSSLEAEVAMVAKVQDAVQAAKRQAVFVYASQPQAVSQRRSLQTDSGLASAFNYTGFGNYTSCGTLCQVQVRWLEGMLAILFLAIAACSGMTCLFLMNGPSRFETAKESL